MNADLLKEGFLPKTHMVWFESEGVLRVGTAGDESSFTPCLEVDSGRLGGILGEVFCLGSA